MKCAAWLQPLPTSSRALAVARMIGDFMAKIPVKVMSPNDTKVFKKKLWKVPLQNYANRPYLSSCGHNGPWTCIT